MIIKLLAAAAIHTDGGTQTRAAIDAAMVEEYADAMRRGDKFPAPVVLYDGSEYWLADGFHRVAALKAIGKAKIDCAIRQGTREDAVWFSCGANKGHGLRRTNDDKRQAVTSALRLRPDSSDRAIAEHCGVSHDLVATVRREIAPAVVESTTRSRRGKDGRTTTTAPAKQAAGGKASAAKRQPAPVADTFDSDDGRTHCEEPEVVKPTPSAPTPRPAPMVEVPRVFSDAYHRAAEVLDALEAGEAVQLCKAYLRKRGIA